MFNEGFSKSQNSLKEIFMYTALSVKEKEKLSFLLVGGNSDTIIFKLEDNFLKQCIVQGIARFSCNAQLS